MGEQKKFRSDAARKNYEKAERQRVQAKKRKERVVKTGEMNEYAKAWLKEHPIKSLLTVSAVAVVLTLALLISPALTDPLKGRQDNWLILDVSANSSHDYRHLADFNIPQGYTKDAYSLYDDGVQQDFFCKADDANAVIQDVYITGAKGVKAADYPAAVLSYGIHKEAGEPKTLTIGGQECSAVYLTSDESPWDGEGMAIAHMSFYFDTPHGACVSATFRSGTMQYDQLPDEATLQAEAVKILANLTLVK